MTTGDGDSYFDGRVRSLQIVIVALVFGILAFAGVVGMLYAQGSVPSARGLDVISYAAVGFAALQLVVRQVLMRAMDAGARMKLLRTPAEATTMPLIDAYAARTIIGAALLEGAAFFFLVAFLLDGQPWTLGGGLLFAVLLAVLHHPTRDRVEHWVTAQQHRLAEERLAR
jgi:hypothetical protein